MIKILIYLIILAAPSLFAMEKEKFPWENLPKDVKGEALNYMWEPISRENPKTLAESLIESLKQYNKIPKTNKDLYDQITYSYNAYLNNLTENDFKKLNQYISGRLYLMELPPDFNLLVRFLKKFNKLTKTNMNKINRDLIDATSNNNLHYVEELIKAGADLETRDHFEDTALIIASRNEYTDLAELLINSGANVNVSNKLGFTPLIVASFYNCNKILELLIKAGANINTKSKEGLTALDFAFQNRNVEIIELLKKYGAIE